jgi:hypothetical protein
MSALKERLEKLSGVEADEQEIPAAEIERMMIAAAGKLSGGKGPRLWE